MKKIWIAVSLLLCGALLAGCNDSGESQPVSESQPASVSAVQSEPASESESQSQSVTSSASVDPNAVVNPLMEYDTVEAAQEAMGITAKVPEWLPEGYTQTLVQTIDNNVLEIRYANDIGGEMSYRFAVGSQDISGDYNEYEVDSAFTSGDISGNMFGYARDDYVLMILRDGDNSYALSFSEGQTADTLNKIINSIG